MSIKSLINFFKINGFIVVFSLLIYLVQSYFLSLSLFFKIILFVAMYFFRNMILVKAITYIGAHKPLVNNGSIVRTENFNGEFTLYTLGASVIEALTYILILYVFNFCDTHIIMNLITFIPKSFIFEIIFDFFHYWGHRFLHENRTMYRLFHKTHHYHINLEPILTFYQNPIDLLLTNSLPMILSIAIFCMFFNLSLFELTLIVVYKVIIEIAGHTGRKSYPTSSFFQCVWLPRLLGFELYTEDHNKHHTHIDCNYSKRFSLWDRVFGTYK